MATRRMRIKAVINVPRGGPKQEQLLEQPLPSPGPAPVADVLPASPAAVAVLSPRICSGPVSPAMGVGDPVPVQNIPDAPSLGGETNVGATTLGSSPLRAATPPAEKIPSSPKSPASWKQLQRPSPSKSPAGLPPSGSVIRRSPSPALMHARLSNSPGPSGLSSPLSPVKSLVSSFTSPSPKNNALYEALSGISNRTHTTVIPTAPPTFVSRAGEPNSFVYPTAVSPAPDMNVKSPPYFRPPPSPSPSHQDFHSVKSPPAGVMSRPSPAQSPVFGISGLRTSSSFLSHHFNSNSNSADSHEVAALMANSNNNSVPFCPPGGGVFPHSPEKSTRHSSGRDSTSRGSENSCPYPGVGMGAFSSISNKDNICPSPSFSKTMFDNPDNLKRRLEERRKEAPNPTKFAQARRDFFEKVNNGQTPERSKLTMLHFTFYNPPKPGGSDSDKPGRKGKPRSSRASSVCSEMESSNKEIILDDKKAASAPSSIGSRRTTASSIGSGGSVVSAHDDCQSEAGSTASNSSSNVPGPRVKVGPDGQLIIDEQSLVVETCESQRARKQIEDMEVVSGADYAVGSSGFYRYKRSYRRGHDWTEKETIRFYRALNQCGTDFSMMLSLFPNRSRQELKSKFKREDRKNPDMISKALASCHFDPDEGISSDEELALYYGKDKTKNADGLTEKEKLLREEIEVEEVVCSSEDPIQPKTKKKKKKNKIEFNAAQQNEFKNFKGFGTAKGKSWNTPVVGLTGKLPPMPNPSSVTPIFTIPEPVSVKLEPVIKLPPKKKAVRKPKKVENVGDGGATVPIIVAPGVVNAGPVDSGNVLPFLTIKKEKVDAVPTSSQEKVQPPVVTETEEPQKGKRRRMTKAKPNVKIESSKRNKPGNPAEVTQNPEAVPGNSSSQTTKSALVCDDLFRYDASDPLGLNVTPVPLPVVEETVLEGNEEGREGLVMVDLDELNAVVMEQAGSSSAGTQQAEEKTRGHSSKRSRKPSSNTDGIAVTTTMLDHGDFGDPFGKNNMTTTMTAIKKEKDVGASGVSAATKKVKVLPYRVPGPGGTLSDCRRTSLADELEIEIELNSPSTES
ncbi:unnamed protein product [Orchesella dallaii]|uniref:Myb-like domain-containing protein n=1 Tax=Orchesella dallaii TaxID=48710 RepID=A0ABP1RRH7_9HEXA